jgi:hypothetical protein
MKLYDGGRAPNPRRVRVYLAEKGIKIPTEQVDLGAMAQKSAAYSAVNPLQRVPALSSTTARSSPSRSRFAAISSNSSRNRRCSAATLRTWRSWKCGSGGWN